MYADMAGQDMALLKEAAEISKHAVIEIERGVSAIVEGTVEEGDFVDPLDPLGGDGEGESAADLLAMCKFCPSSLTLCHSSSDTSDF